MIKDRLDRHGDADHPEWDEGDRTSVLADTLGPAMAEIGSYAPGPRAAKTALAVGLAWWLATLLGEPRPLFAALGALVGVEATIVASMRRTGLQLAGILGGIVLAAVFARLGGVSPLVIGAAVLFGLWLGRLVGSPNRVGVELGVTALLVVTLGQGDPSFAAARLWETALGGLVATTVNALILPPNYLGEVADYLDRLAERVSRGLLEAVRVFVELPHHEGAAETMQRLRTVRAGIPQMEDRLELAEQALRFSPLLRNQWPELERCRSALRLYRRWAAHAARIARVVQQHAERPHTWSHELKSPSNLLQAAKALAEVLAACQQWVRTADRGELLQMAAKLDTARTALAAFYKVVEVERAGTEVERFMDVAAIASELEHMVLDADEFLSGSQLTHRA